MAATHRLSRANVSIRTSLSPEQVAEISKHVGENTKGDAWNGINNVGFDGAAPGRMNFAIRNFNRKAGNALMKFHVSIKEQDDGSVATTAIDMFRTVRNYFIIIPLPKKLVGYVTYRRFMDSFGTAIRARDAGASVTITEVVAR
jgi:hypothetical protein